MTALFLSSLLGLLLFYAFDRLERVVDRWRGSLSE
jgi:ABC-type nitrate/sulfonate/bicarbonate transport system permease component